MLMLMIKTWTSWSSRLHSYFEWEKCGFPSYFHGSNVYNFLKTKSDVENWKCGECGKGMFFKSFPSFEKSNKKGEGGLTFLERHCLSSDGLIDPLEGWETFHFLTLIPIPILSSLSFLSLFLSRSHFLSVSPIPILSCFPSLSFASSGSHSWLKRAREARRVDERDNGSH